MLVLFESTDEIVDYLNDIATYTKDGAKVGDGWEIGGEEEGI